MKTITAASARVPGLVAARCLLLLFMAMTIPGLSHGQTQGDLLPVDAAFRLTVETRGDGLLALSWDIAENYYLYRDRIQVRALDDGVTLGELVLPAGIDKHDEYFGDVQIYRQHAVAELAYGLAEPGAASRIAITVQGCHEADPLICYPPHTVTLDLDGGALGGRAATGIGGSVEGPPGGGAGTVAASGPGAAVIAIVLAILGGLILNLMPCVLPVLSLKALSLAQSGASRRESRLHALWYTAGVLVSFSALGLLIIALRNAGLGLGWGFQLQQPLAVGVLTYVMFALGLSLSGVVVFATRLAGAGDGLTRRSGPAGDFFTGMLVVVVASPCTAPFMGVALSVALGAPGWLSLAIFLALGLGLALPFLAIGFIPALSARLPRPGAWMETLKQFFAFPLYATAAWLAWVLTRQRGADGLAWLLAGLLLLALGLWLGERLRHNRRPWLRPAAWLIALSAALPLWQIHQLSPAAAQALAQFADGSLRYSPSALERLRRDGRTVFVNITADWCITCKANERRVFDTPAFRDALRQNEAVYVKGDWTNTDGEITRFLETHGAVGVPLYVVFHPGAAGKVLPTVPSWVQINAELAGENL
jgi:thiol:disulfide interchange protein DsbD